MESGAFDNLPGQGEPLELEDDSLVPEELRPAYRILKNSGHLPPELEPQRELRELEDFLMRAEGPTGCNRAWARFRLLVDRIRLSRCSEKTPVHLEQAYKEKLLRRLDDSPLSEVDEHPSHKSDR